MPHLKAISKKTGAARDDVFPFNIAAVRCLERIEFRRPVTFFVAFPDAEIYSFDLQPIATVAYDELEHVTLTRAFLSDPGAFLHRL